MLLPSWALPGLCRFLRVTLYPLLQHCTVLKKEKKNRSDITPDPGGHWPQRPCAQGRTCAKQDQAQASAPGQNRTQCGGGATTHGLRTRQAGKSVPTQLSAHWSIVASAAVNILSLPACRLYLSFLGKDCDQQGSEGELLRAFDRWMGCIASRATLTAAAACGRVRCHASQ